MDEEVDDSICASGNRPVLIQGTGKQLLRGWVSQRDALVRWTSWQQGQTLGEESFSPEMEMHVRALQPCTSTL